MKQQYGVGWNSMSAFYFTDEKLQQILSRYCVSARKEIDKQLECIHRHYTEWRKNGAILSHCKYS